MVRDHGLSRLLGELFHALRHGHQLYLVRHMAAALYTFLTLWSGWNVCIFLRQMLLRAKQSETVIRVYLDVLARPRHHFVTRVWIQLLL